MDKEIRYLPDIVGNNKNNRVENESHKLDRQVKNRIITPLYGCFYSKDFEIKDTFRNKKLKHKKDYIFGGLRKNYTVTADAEVFSFIIVINDKVSERVAISYNAYGDPQQGASEVTVDLLEQGNPIGEVVPYKKIKNRPKAFKPTFHYHDIGDIEKMETLLFFIDKIRFALFYNNKELFVFLSKIDALLQVLIERSVSEYESILFKTIKKFYDDFTLDLFNLGKIKNYGLMTEEDGTKIADGTHPVDVANKDEKYFSLKALETFSKRIYQLYTNVEETSLGSFEEVRVIPTKEYLESMVIGATITIPALNTLVVTEDIKKLYPTLEEDNCRYVVKKIANKTSNQNSCYLYIHRDEGRTYVMISYYDSGVYKTKFTKIANANDDSFVLQTIDDHKNDYDNPHLDDKRDVLLSQVENLPLASREDIVCNLPVRKYISFSGLLLYMKRFKTGKKDTRDIYEQYSKLNQTRIMQTIFSACGSWKDIDESTIELCRVINHESPPWIRVTESISSLFEGDLEVKFTIECSEHYVGKTLHYILEPQRSVPSLGIYDPSEMGSAFDPEFERKTLKWIDIEGGYNYDVDDPVLYSTPAYEFLTLSGTTTVMIYRPNFFHNPAFLPYNNNSGARLMAIVPVDRYFTEPLPLKFKLYEFSGSSTGTTVLGENIATSGTVILNPEPNRLIINITNDEGSYLGVFYRFKTSTYTSDWIYSPQQVWGDFDLKFISQSIWNTSDIKRNSKEVDLFINSFRDSLTGTPSTDKIIIEVRAGWRYYLDYNNESEETHPSLVPLKLTTYLLTGISEISDTTTDDFENHGIIENKITTLSRCLLEEHNSGDLEYDNDSYQQNIMNQTQLMCNVTYDFVTRALTVDVFQEPNTTSTTSTSTTSTSTTTTTSTTTSTTSTTTTTTRPPSVAHRPLELAFIGYQDSEIEFSKTGYDSFLEPYYTSETIYTRTFRASRRSSRSKNDLFVYNVLRPRKLSGGFIEPINDIKIRYFPFDFSWNPAKPFWEIDVVNQYNNTETTYKNCNVDNEYYKNWIAGRSELSASDRFVTTEISDVNIQNLDCKKIGFKIIPSHEKLNPEWNRVTTETFNYCGYNSIKIQPSSNKGQDEWFLEEVCYVELIVNDYWVYIGRLESSRLWASVPGSSPPTIIGTCPDRHHIFDLAASGFFTYSLLLSGVWLNQNGF